MSSPESPTPTATPPSVDRLGRTLPLAKPHLYVHLPKTGGTTLSRLVRWSTGRAGFAHFWLPPTPQELARALGKPRLEVVYGHLPYGFHRWFSRVGESECVNGHYICFLRNPVDRVVSHYHNDRRRPVPTVAKEHDLRGYVERVEVNVMTQMIAGAKHGAWWNHPDRGYREPDESQDPPVTEAMFELAASRLRDEFGFVGLTERFDDSLLLMHSILGLPALASHHGNRRQGPREAIDPSLRELIETRAQWDLRLYRVAEQVFEQQVAAFGGEQALERRRAEQGVWGPRLNLLRYVSGPAVISVARQLRGKLRRWRKRRQRRLGWPV